MLGFLQVQGCIVRYCAVAGASANRIESVSKVRGGDLTSGPVHNIVAWPRHPFLL